MSQKSLTTPGTVLLVGVLLPPRGGSVSGAEHASEEAKDGPQFSILPAWRELLLHHGTP